ncbi:nicotinate-nucleotide--dimethylbenzimidazole phosphoribosyltransferase [Streptomyces sp. NBC_00620]|uniref:nicotinate-nucleotide--dimethylbenzimidazole phosphoribosyltransferase n=1 Tax=unclassified Streptomyces TaxID=2593676 RepID=UPI00225A9C94|nr:nicotinate-nucleotide--dimethylbenzimidazole phosphoribosyltransferase [Streptomyces sp. NBC_00620]MCX4975981.1 nicotinate-nucleotide--dimethylbenzimidazole phosphoribosyltransferase [Streptomyces sp. NBC_00620]WUC09880.1 nicotinate-nucleotide--dimethylbenzimidazole phosphoribosyltransferase [Streptomyces sp. NBC_00564]
MTDTGQVPGEGLPENAGMVDQPGVLAPGAYTFLDPSENPADDDDLLLMPGAPGAQGAWGNEVPPPAPMPFVHESGPHEQGPHETGPHEPVAYEPGAHEPGALESALHETVPHESAPHESGSDEPGPHETAGRDSGSVDLGAVRVPDPAPVLQPTPPRRPLHLGPPTPDGSASPVRSLADRGPAGAPVSPAAGAPFTAPATPVRHQGPPTAGPEYLDVPQLSEIPPQGAVPWGVPPSGPEQVAAETVVPEPVQEPQQSAEESQGLEPAPVLGTEHAAHDQAQEQAQEQSQDVAEAQVLAEAAQLPGLALASQDQDAPVAQALAHAPESPDAFALPADEAAQAPEAASSSDGPLNPHLPQTVDETPFLAASTVLDTPHAPEQPEDAEPAAEAYAPAHLAVQAPAPSEGEHFAPEPHAVVEQSPAPEQNAAFEQSPTPEPNPRRALATPPQITDPAPQFPAQAAQFGAPAVHIADPAAQFADAPHGPDHALTQLQPQAHVQVAPGFPAPAHTAFAEVDATEALQGVQVGAEPLQGVPAGVGAHAQASHAAVGQAHGEHFPASGDGGGAGAGPSELPDAPHEPHADQSLGQFVPVEGTVPTTPHLAPTPPHAMTVPPFPSEEQPTADEPAEQPILVAPAPVQETAEAPAGETSQTPAAETELVAPVPAPREAEVVEAAAEAAPEVEAPPVPEPLPAAPETVVAQQADDLDTQGADQEESTAAVEDVRESTGPAAPGYNDAEREAVLRVMRERRDIRNGFRSDPIPHDVLLRVLEAAHTAPSVGHSQPWDFVVIRSADTRRSMHELAARQREAYAKSLPKGRAKQFKELKIEAILDTPVNIVVTADPTRGGRHTLGRHTQPQMAPYSSALAVENLWLAARAEGLGVGWVSFFDEREMVRALGLPEHLEVVAYLCVGYVDEFPDEPELMQAGWSKRRPLSWVVHEETYGRRALPGEEPHDLLAETISNIRPLDAKALGEAWERQKRMTKPAGALGMLEIISAQLSGLSRMCPPPIPEPAAVAIFAGDHGVHAQGVTHWPQEVTAQMVANFLGGGAVCNAFANQVGAEVCVIDVGVASDLPATPGLLPRKIRLGTADMTTGPAMTREEVIAAIEVGIETARDLVAAGNKALLTGEMGIANTTASAALISVFTDTDPSEVTGRGTGINDETLARKTEVVRRAIDLHQPDPADPIGVMAAIGGLEHAAMVGLLLGGASLRTPVILDGVSAGAAALVARAIAPEVLAACIAGHRSAEPGHVAALNKLGLRPLVDLDLRLGEGTGALLALPVVQSAARAMHEVATFDSAGVTEK